MITTSIMNRFAATLTLSALLYAATASAAAGDAARDQAFKDQRSTARFLSQATFGPTPGDINQLRGSSASEWFQAQLALPPTYLMPIFEEYAERAEESESDDEFDLLANEGATFGFWRNAVSAPDQLRQRMAFALSELLVVSNGGGEVLTDVPQAVTWYQDLLIEHAFGNYRELLEAVTYSPAMGYYLTYMGNERGDPATGRVPDENYAREIMQLFTIGVLELNLNGTPKRDSDGQPIETYSNADVTGLARVFTGLNLDERFYDVEEDADALAYSTPMAIFPESHSERPKQFLGTTIPANTPAAESIDAALDHLFAHPNVGPFVGRQIIQRFTSSSPNKGYVKRVAQAFNRGSYRLPDGSQVGTGQRGDLAATLAAVLFDPQARKPKGKAAGKVREPILRFTHWARAFRVQQVTPEYNWQLWDTSGPGMLGQHPYRAQSVFNFFRPGYVAPGTETGKRGLTVPELQIVNASSVPGYTNFMTGFVFAWQQYEDIEELQEEYDEEGIGLDASRVVTSFLPNYRSELSRAEDADALLRRLDLLLTHGQLSSATRNAVKEAINAIPVYDEESLDYRVKFAILMIMTSPDYLVLR
ncbi:MAG: DUF1800 domain-containing protein [Pseudomonadota bacterium]